MAEIIFKNDVAISLGSIDGEEDIKPKARISINPPPEDGRCECCGRHISELKPFGGPGDPLVGDFTGAKLVKKFRPDGPYNEEAEMAFAEAEKQYRTEGFDDPLDWMIDNYGKEKAIELHDAVEMHGTVGKSWECRDCAVLDANEYHEKLNQSWADHNEDKN